MSAKNVTVKYQPDGNLLEISVDSLDYQGSIVLTDEETHELIEQISEISYSSDLAENEDR